MTMRMLAYGERALLVECSSLAAATDLLLRLTGSQRPVELEDAVVGGQSVLVVARSAAQLAPLRAVVQRCAVTATPDDAPSNAPDTTSTARRDELSDPVEILVDYGGPDLAEVARLTGLTTEEVVEAHTGRPWRVGFAGFAPGFAYLVGGDPRLRVPRRATPRVSIPAGSVALADGFSGIYPRSSPGGWQVIGTTEAPLWDLNRVPPALLTPGREVRFVARYHEGRAERPTRHPEPRLPEPSRTERPHAELEVLATARPALVQDAGRPGLSHLGVSPSGAADHAAYQLGARLLGQGGDCAALEILLGELVVRAHGSLTAVLTGAPVPAEAEGRAQAHAAPFLLRDGEVLRLGRPALGLRTYLSVRGGIAVPAVLGSRSRDTLAALGPEPVIAGDVLPVGASHGWPTVDVAPVAPLPAGRVDLRGTWGPHADRLGSGRMLGLTWSVTPDSDRVALRLAPADGSRAGGAFADTSEVPPVGLLRGAIQLPPSGLPVVFLDDHPVTGGYPVVAVLDAVSCDRAAQLRPGAVVRLAVT